MDEHGIEMMLLSLNAPAVQAIPDPRSARSRSRARPTIFSPKRSRKRPDRFQGLAALPMQDPDVAARELERCVKELGFRGALVNGFSQVGDADTRASTTTCRNTGRSGRRSSGSTCRSICIRAIRCRATRRSTTAIRWLLGPTWAFGQETAVHALRLMGSGLFDAHPRLQIILGHLGEGLPFSMWRVDNRNAWIKAPQQLSGEEEDRAIISATISTSPRRAISARQALIDAMLEIGADRIMFSTDWPFENIDHAANWFDACRHQRERPAQDRPHQRAAAVQAGERLSRTPRAGRLAGAQSPATAW